MNNTKEKEEKLIFCSKVLRFLKDIGLPNYASLRTLYFHICLYRNCPVTALNRLFDYNTSLIHRHQAHWREIFNEEYEAYEKRQRVTTADLLKLIANSSYGCYDASNNSATYFAPKYSTTWTSADASSSEWRDGNQIYSILDNLYQNLDF